MAKIRDMDDSFICVWMNEKDNSAGMKSKRLLTFSELASYSDHKFDDGGESFSTFLFSIHIGIVIFCFHFHCCCCHCYYCVVFDEVCIVLWRLPWKECFQQWFIHSRMHGLNSISLFSMLWLEIKNTLRKKRTFYVFSSTPSF